jgi:AraC-like DNA-binding protein
MPSSFFRTFGDPDEYATAIRQGTHRITVTQRGRFTAKLTRIDLHRLWMQHFSEDLPRTSHVQGWGGRAIIAFRTQPGSSVTRNGIELGSTHISRLRPGLSYYQRTSGPTAYATMSLPLDEMASIGGTIAGHDLTPPYDEGTITPPPEVMARLQRLHATARGLAEDAPAVLSHPEVARGLEQTLIEAMIHCLGSVEVREDRAAERHHAAIMRRFHRVIEDHIDEPLYVPELCKAVGASERTLLACCQEHLGIGPKRYLLLRRMHLVRRALRESSPADTTITEIATRFGFWQFGRLAVAYKALFGEAPSATLRHSIQ